MVTTCKGKMILLLGIVGLAYVISLFLFNPESNTLFPKCPFYLITQFQCPACGSQRAFHFLLHGDITKALSYNPFLVISLPYLAIIIFSTFNHTNLAMCARQVFQNKYVVNIYIVLFFAWWIIRNI